MTNINQKWHKPETYAPEDAIWANVNNAMIVDKGTYYIVEAIPVQPISEQNKAIRATREQLYSSQIDPLHARKARKVILNDWSEADEAEYIAEVARLSVQIEDENPYIEEDNSDSVLSGEPENMA